MPRPYVVIAACHRPLCTVVMFPAPYGSVTIAASVRTPRSSRCTVPTPACNSPTTLAINTSPRSRAPARCNMSADSIIAATPPFMFWRP